MRGAAVMMAWMAAVLPAEAREQEKGLALGLFASSPEYDYSDLVHEIADLGARHMTVVWIWWMDDARSNVIRPVRGWSATDAQIARVLDVARQRGLRVTALPIVRLVHAETGQWRGVIEPDSEDRWWASYNAFILHSAHLAARGGARRFSVGSELLSREAMRSRWLALIDRVRIETPALETLYSANWDHYEHVSFWDAVDVAGMTAYFELHAPADLARLRAAWRPFRAEIQAFSGHIGRPVLITEIGYPSLVGALQRPWDETRKAAIDLRVQALGYQAFIDAFRGERGIQGAHFWNWFGFGGPSDGGYTPRGKPAARVLQDWFREPKPSLASR